MTYQPPERIAVDMDYSTFPDELHGDADLRHVHTTEVKGEAGLVAEIIRCAIQTADGHNLHRLSKDLDHQEYLKAEARKWLLTGQWEPLWEKCGCNPESMWYVLRRTYAWARG